MSSFSHTFALQLQELWMFSQFLEGHREACEAAFSHRQTFESLPRLINEQLGLVKSLAYIFPPMEDHFLRLYPFLPFY